MINVQLYIHRKYCQSLTKINIIPTFKVVVSKAIIVKLLTDIRINGTQNKTLDTCYLFEILKFTWKTVELQYVYNLP